MRAVPLVVLGALACQAVHASPWSDTDERMVDRVLAEQIFAAQDQNSDGVIDRAEIAAVAGKRDTPPGGGVWVTAAFLARFDANSDGKLSRAEYLDIVLARTIRRIDATDQR